MVSFKMNKSNFPFFMMVLSAIGFVVGTGIIITDSPLNSLCQRCWLNYLLYALFGEQWGKTVLGALWYLVAGSFFIIALKARIKNKRNRD